MSSGVEFQSMMSRRVFGLSFLFTERLCTYTSNLRLFPAFTAGSLRDRDLSGLIT